ncbi:MAG: transglycosylase SLT domain-containing protein [Bacteriovoracaceae bacterium]|jgi:hypothetical protein|nr:transglycosylase SLT domain-containing protein [Bacteriovoracaceae bacterium]
MANYIVLFLFLVSICSCAGPTTPFGGDIFIGEEFKVENSITRDDIDVLFSPDRQYYNSPYHLKIKLKDPNFDIKSFRYEIVYNHRKLNRWFKAEEIKIPESPDGPVEINFKNLSLLPGNVNHISFLYYPKGEQYPIIHKLKLPECYRNSQPEDFITKPFEVSELLKHNIKAISKKYKYNSALTAALIAQESSFNPKALSYAKALGLTQVTSAAHSEISKIKKNWNIYPKLDQMSLGKIKTSIKNSKINRHNDWRLDINKSIEGGLLYMEYLNSYWSTPVKEELLQRTFQNEPIPRTDILLASYNSGPYRVSKALAKNQKEWLFSASLSEARKYVMNIKSYCYSFKQGSQYEN